MALEHVSIRLQTGMLLEVDSIIPLFWTSLPPKGSKIHKACHQEIICLINLFILDWIERGWFGDSVAVVGIGVHVVVVVIVS